MKLVRSIAVREVVPLLLLLFTLALPVVRIVAGVTMPRIQRFYLLCKESAADCLQAYCETT
jgi:hypothetical protein